MPGGRQRVNLKNRQRRLDKELKEAQTEYVKLRVKELNREQQ
jgi:hypothetical protein